MLHDVYPSEIQEEHLLCLMAAPSLELLLLSFAFRAGTGAVYQRERRRLQVRRWGQARARLPPPLLLLLLLLGLPCCSHCNPPPLALPLLLPMAVLAHASRSQWSGGAARQRHFT